MPLRNFDNRLQKFSQLFLNSQPFLKFEDRLYRKEQKMATMFTLDVVMKKLSAKLDSIDIEGLSRETGFVQRQC
ncbi:MAG: hypothetical protein D6681_07780, partial [Calditrichaeota bacterium]